MNRAIGKGGYTTIGVLMLLGAAFCWQRCLADEQGLAIPEHTRIVAALQAEGVQIYEGKPQPNGSLGWSLVGPDAKLKNLDGSPVGSHSIGPVWKADDGSEIKATRAPLANWKSPDPKNVAWLLLEVGSQGGAGLFADVHYVMRVSTIGGAAPSDAPGQTGQRVSVPYRAIYLFLAATEEAKR